MQFADRARTSRAGKPRAGGQIGPRADRGGALILGAVIAGGRSSRFGSDKALALLEGKPLIEHALDALRPFCAEIVVCGRDWAAETSLSDYPRPHLGPLGGIAAALRYAEAKGYTAVLTIGCDMPRIPASRLEALTAACPAFCEGAPILGCWSLDQRALLETMLTESGDKGPSIRRWAIDSGARAISGSPPNVNTPADLTAL